MKRKILAVALAVMMLVSVLPTSVFAAEANGECAYHGKTHTLELVPDAIQLGSPVPAVCGKIGYTLYECPDCGDFFADNFVPAPSQHVWEVIEDQIDANCDRDGKTAVEKCSNPDCNVVRGGDPIKSVGHNYVVEVLDGGNCETGMKTHLVCEYCGKEKKDSIVETPAAGHTWSMHPVIDKEPTYESTGLAHYECTVEGCGAKSESIIILAECNHVRQIVDYKAPTCTEAGNRAYEICAGCDAWFYPNTSLEVAKDLDGNYNVALSALGHSEVKGEPVAPTCDKDGYTPYTCARCDWSENRDIVAAAHKLVAVEVVAPTCTEQGYTKFECSECDHTENGKYVEARHEYGDEPAYEVKPTCDKVGVKAYFCLICQEPKEIEYVPALGHASFEEAVERYNELKKIYDEEYAKFEASALVDSFSGAVDQKNYWDGVEYTFTAATAGTYKFDVDNADVGYYDADFWTAYFPAEVTLDAGESVTFLLTSEWTMWGPVEFTLSVLNLSLEAPVAPVAPIETLPNCTEDGSRAWLCARCDAECYEEADTNPALAAHGHAWRIAYRPSTCGTYGFRFQHCVNEDCPLPEVRGYYDDNWNYVYLTVDPEDPTKVVENGVAVHINKDENGKNVIFPINELDPENHVWVTESVREATCYENGLKVTFCQDCKLYNYEVLPAGHNYTLEETIDATCTSEGYNYYVCGGCGDSYYEPIVISHNYKLAETVAPVDCQTPGYDKFECELCGDVYFDNYTYYVLKNEYSLNQAIAEHTLSTSRSDPLSGYSFDIHGYHYEVMREGSCEELGLRKYYCVDCETILFVSVDGTGNGHQVPADEWFSSEANTNPDVWHLAKEPTCTENGYTLVYPCTQCGETIGEYDGNTPIQTVIPPLNHMNGEESAIVKLEAVKPTCTTTGLTAGEYCTLCDYKVEQKVIDSLGHNGAPMEGYDAVADCYNFGYQLNHCLNEGCDLYYIDNYVPALGHTGAEEIARVYDCENGIVTITYGCARCRMYHVVEELAVKGHVDAEGNVIVPNCADDQTCANCQLVITGEHDLFEYTVPATCLEWAYRIEKCYNCEYNKVENIQEIGDHNFVVVESKPATFTEEGYEKLECSVCGAKDEKVLPVLMGIEFIASVDNAVYAGAGYADSSLVKLTVKLNSVGAKLSALRVDVLYNADVVDFVEAKFISEELSAVAMANDNGGYVTVVADSGRADVLIADHVLVDLYFRVNNADAKSAEFSFANMECRDIDYKLLQANGNVAAIEIVKFMDLDRDGEITLADCMQAYDIMAGASEVIYDVTIDLNKDGEIALDDVLALYELIAGSKTYEDIYNMGV